MGAPRSSKPVLCILALSFVGGALAGAACGGSSSESPWPAEPDSPVLGPEGEEGAARPADQAPDAGAGEDASPAAPPNVEP